ncbi:MAG TPA: SpoIIE family protein phosphatase [Planctomycetota bacterium]|nr:SpoIIE family protein phosphatase [Planctomycetota bacterium]
MAESTPPKPTRRIPSAGSSPGLKPVGQRPSSSTQIPHTGRTTTARRAAPPPASRAEVVASSDDIGASSVRSTMARGASNPRGLSLRWKIVCAMTGITIATAILIFVVVYKKAVDQLSSEIDSKGVRLCKTLATIDGTYWKAAIGSSKDARKKKLDLFLQKVPGMEWSDALREQRLRANPELKELYDQLQDPLGPLSPLKTKDIGKGTEIMQISVLDVGMSESVQAVEGYGEKGLTIYTPSKRRDPAGVDISDGRDKQTDSEVRLFTMDREAAGVGKLRFNVILSLDHINDARSSLRTAIFLPIFVSVLLGTGIAIWISTLITDPIKILVHDMQQVSSGNLQHQTTARSKDEIGLLAMTFNRMTQAIRAAHEQELDQKALEHDLLIASEIQSNLVPKRMLKVPGYDVSAYYRPSKEVGGDYYDFLSINEDLEGIIVADVSGKGVPGSLVMTMARAFIRMEAEQNHNVSAASTLMQANRMLAQDIKKGMFVTALYCILDKRTNEIRVASAGHNPLIVWRAAANKVELVNPPGIALGFDKGPVFERTVKEEKLVLNHGDRIVAYTDGTVEAMNAANQEFGDKRFQDLIQRLAVRDSNQMLNLVVKTLDDHKGDAPQSDDITIVTLRYL